MLICFKLVKVFDLRRTNLNGGQKEIEGWYFSNFDQSVYKKSYSSRSMLLTVKRLS